MHFTPFIHTYNFIIEKHVYSQNHVGVVSVCGRRCVDSKGQSSPPAASAGTMSSSKDVEMKDAEEEKPKEKEAEEDPKQAQKDKDLLTFEGKATIYILMGTNKSFYPPLF